MFGLTQLQVFRGCKITGNTQNCQCTTQIYNKNQPSPEVHFQKNCLGEQSRQKTSQEQHGSLVAEAKIKNVSFS